MGSIFTLEADDPQTDTVISKLQKSQVKNTRVLSQTKKNTILSTSNPKKKKKQTKPDQQPPKKRTQEKRNHPLPPLTADNKLPPLGPPTPTTTSHTH
jgi:hypothetical protein